MLLTGDSVPTRAFMHIFVILFGIGSWLAINGVWVELPILVDNLPEAWTLPSYLSILCQVANIGPLAVTLTLAFCSRHYHQNVLIYIMLFTGTLSCFLLVFFWNSTTTIHGQEHSISFFILFLMLSFVDCTSSVTFMPYIKRFQYVFITTYFIGEGLSGFLPSLVALAQGASQISCENITVVNTTSNTSHTEIIAKYDDPRFSVEVFFGFLFLMMSLCLMAFAVLNHSNLAKIFLQNDDDDSNEEGDVGQSTSTELSTFNNDGRGDYEKTNETDADESDLEDIDTHKADVAALTKSPSLSRGDYIYFFSLVFWISCIANGAMPSISSYTSLPYGQLPYHFAATFGAMANPVACFIALFLPVRSRIIISVFATVTTGCAAYLMLLALQSPCPVLIGTTGGATLMVLSQVLFVFTTSYAKVSIGQILRENGHAKSLVWYGAFTQLGALVGALTMFPLVNVYYFFTSGNQCTSVC